MGGRVRRKNKRRHRRHKNKKHFIPSPLDGNRFQTGGLVFSPVIRGVRKKKKRQIKKNGRVRKKWQLQNG